MAGQNLTPNQSPYPSSITNTPEFAALLSSPGAVMSIGTVKEEAAIAAPDGSTLYTPRGPINDLMSLRQRFPFLPILPLMGEGVAVFLAAGVAQDLQIPDGASLMCIRGNNDFYISVHGNAEVPTATNAVPGPSQTKSFYAPQGFLYFVGGLSNFSVVAPNANTIVTACFYSPDQMPR